MYKIVPKEITTKIVILGITKYNEGYCIAGMSEEGKWFRPVSNYADYFWEYNKLFMADRFVETGDIWEINGTFELSTSRPNHVEDFRIKPTSPPKFCGKFKHDELILFLQNNLSTDIQFRGIVGYDHRSTHKVVGSLCLIKSSEFGVYNRPYEGQNRYYVEIDGYRNPKQSHGGFRFNCIKSLGLFKPTKLYKITSFFIIGLSAPFKGLEHPSIIGIHSEDTENPANGYPHLNK